MYISMEKQEGMLKKEEKEINFVAQRFKTYHR